MQCSLTERKQLAAKGMDYNEFARYYLHENYLRGIPRSLYVWRPWKTWVVPSLKAVTIITLVGENFEEHKHVMLPYYSSKSPQWKMILENET